MCYHLAVGGDWFERMFYVILPQVFPNFTILRPVAIRDQRACFGRFRAGFVGRGRDRWPN